MYDWQEQLNRDAQAQKKRWNGKVITTGRQWTENAYGSSEPACGSFDKIYDAVKDYRDSRDWG